MKGSLLDLVAKGEAASHLVMELLQSSLEVEKKASLERFLAHLGYESKSTKLRALDLNLLFRVILFERDIFLIPRPRFGQDDILVLKQFDSASAVLTERVTFKGASIEADPNVAFPDYLKECLKRGLHNDLCEERICFG